jgi:NAD(P)-dependent dehydrogenase (short-subunit alcohol dehydrogenase family)
MPSRLGRGILASMKIAIVTGGSRGLGKSACLHIAQKGIGVILTYKQKKTDADAVVASIEAKGGQAVALALDAGDISTFPRFVTEVQKLLQQKWQRKDFDFLINNAGVGVHAAFAETTEEQFDQLLNVHFKGTFFLTQKLLPLIANGGRIINTSSGLARFTMPGYAAYAAMKGAIEVLTRYLAKELGPRKISVNTVAPGAIETDFGGGTVRDNKQVNDMIAAQTPLGRVGLPDDIGGLIAALLTEDTRWVNAQRIEASGGIQS